MLAAPWLWQGYSPILLMALWGYNLPDLPEKPIPVPMGGSSVPCPCSPAALPSPPTAPSLCPMRALCPLTQPQICLPEPFAGTGSFVWGSRGESEPTGTGRGWRVLLPSVVPLVSEGRAACAQKFLLARKSSLAAGNRPGGLRRQGDSWGAALWCCYTHPLGAAGGAPVPPPAPSGAVRGCVTAVALPPLPLLTPF